MKVEHWFESGQQTHFHSHLLLRRKWEASPEHWLFALTLVDGYLEGLSRAGLLPLVGLGLAGQEQGPETHLLQE